MRKLRTGKGQRSYEYSQNDLVYVKDKLSERDYNLFENYINDKKCTYFQLSLKYNIHENHVSKIFRNIREILQPENHQFPVKEELKITRTFSPKTVIHKTRKYHKSPNYRKVVAPAIPAKVSTENERESKYLLAFAIGVVVFIAFTIAYFYA